MARKPSESGAPEKSPAKKPANRKPAAKKQAAGAKKASDNQDTATPSVESAPVVAPETKIKTVKTASKTSAQSNAAKKSPAKKKASSKIEVSSNVSESAPSASAPVIPTPVTQVAPVAPVAQGTTAKVEATTEKSEHNQSEQKKDDDRQIKVRRESYRRPNEGSHEGHGNEIFAQPETVGGSGEGSFNKRKRRRRNKKGNGNGNGSGDDRSAPEVISIRNLDGKKVAARAWKMFLAEVSEEGLALMDDQTARDAARRAFRCAEFFMLEEARRRQIQKDRQQEQIDPHAEKEKGVDDNAPESDEASDL